MTQATPNKFNIPQSAFQITRPLESPGPQISITTTPSKHSLSSTPRKNQKSSKPGTLSLTPNIVLLSCNSLINFRDKYIRQTEGVQTEPAEIANS